MGRGFAGTLDAKGCSSSSSSASLNDEEDDNLRLLAARGDEGDGSLRMEEAGDKALLGCVSSGGISFSRDL